MALFLGYNKWDLALNNSIYRFNVYIQKLIDDMTIPDYVKAEAIELYDKVNKVRKEDSIVFLAMSDSHYPAEQNTGFYDTENKASSMIANQAAKYLVSAIDFDFFAHLGDVSAGAGSTTPAMLQSQIEGFLAYFREAKGDLPVFIAIGNHDSGIYYHESNATGDVHTMAGDYLYRNFTFRSKSENTVFDGEKYGGYCYRDFNDKKLRVFLLNTSEAIIYAQKDSPRYENSDQCTLGAQRLWFANALIDLNNKADAEEWGFIVLCHYPADYGGNIDLSQLCEAYVKGTSFTIKDPESDYFIGDGTNVTVNFTGKNQAKFIAQFHGHVHNFITSKLHSDTSGTSTEYDAYRICIPNVQFNRENYYGVINNINFQQDTSYTKTAGTADGTSFVVNVINPSDEKIYSFCYGAGYDRIIGYGDTAYYTVVKQLSNATSTRDLWEEVIEGQPYSENITFNSGYEMKSLTVTMSGTDISASSISEGNGYYSIYIPNVTGNIVITAKGQMRPNFTNLVPLSINIDGTDFNVDGDGYDNGTYINSSGVLGTLANCTSTGFIPVTAGAKTIRIAGDGISIDSEYTRFVFYNNNFELITVQPYKHLGSNEYHGALIEESSTVVTFVMNSNTLGQNGVYMRICTKGDGADLIVTVNEKITYGDASIKFAITQNLTNVSSSNMAIEVSNGEAFTTTLTANSGYKMSTVTVIMDGTDITSTVYNNGVINIPEVTGDVVITARAIVSSSSYTNLLPISTDTDDTIYNDIGYMPDTYLSSSTFGPSAKTGYYTSGFIPAKYGDTLYLKNCTFTDQDNYHRIAFYDSSKQALANRIYGPASSTNGLHISWTTDSNNIITSITIRDDAYMQNTGYVRLCCSLFDENSIVTVNEEITEGDIPEEEIISYSINQTLYKVTSSNTSVSAERGTSFSTTLTADVGYVLKTVVVTMNGIDITSSAYSNGVIIISNVTGPIEINAIAEETTITNLIPLAVNSNGDPYNNGQGYKQDYRLSTSTSLEKSCIGAYVSGYIPYTHGDTIVLKNIGTETLPNYGGDSLLMMYYGLGTTASGNGMTAGTAGMFYLAQLTSNSDGSITIPGSTIASQAPSGITYTHFRISSSYIGTDSIATTTN